MQRRRLALLLGVGHVGRRLGVGFVVGQLQVVPAPPLALRAAAAVVVAAPRGRVVVDGVALRGVDAARQILVGPLQSHGLHRRRQRFGLGAQVALEARARRRGRAAPVRVAVARRDEARAVRRDLGPQVPARRLVVHGDAQRQAEQLVLLRRARARRARRAERGPRAPRRRDLAEEHVHRAALGLAVGAPAVQLEGNQFIVGLDVLHGERVRERPVDAVAPDVAQIQIAAAPRVRAVGQRHERVLQRAHGLARGHGDDQLQRPRAQGQLEQRHGDAARLRRRQRQRQAQVGVEGDGLVVAVRAGDVALELAVARVDDDALVAHLEPAPRLARHLGVGPAVRLERLRVGLALDAVQVLVEAV
mmetsp:Transcript_8602/g.29447  ORF Transcript_8602/g.29447 Transcript_8602/m.29447 type:complete len:361 (-) Transcript_8602:331-1413(-)